MNHLCIVYPTTSTSQIFNFKFKLQTTKVLNTVIHSFEKREKKILKKKEKKKEN